MEDALREHFIPELFGSIKHHISDDDCTLYSLRVKCGGLALPNPVLTAARNYNDSRSVTSLLVQHLQEGKELDAHDHKTTVLSARRRLQQDHAKAATNRVDAIIDQVHSLQAKERIRQSQESGAWLTAYPHRKDGSELSALEFRDGLCLQYEIPPQDLPTTCSGCLDKNSVEHSLICQKGGRIIARHNDLRAEWASLCRDALSPSAVETKPLIHYG